MSTRILRANDVITVSCPKCGLHYCLTNEFHDMRVKDREPTYCPNGHPWHYIGEKKNTSPEAEKQIQTLTEKLTKVVKDFAAYVKDS